MADRGEAAFGVLHLRFHLEVVQAANADHHAGQSGGNRDLGGVGKVGFAIDVVIVNLGVERVLGRSDSAAEADGVVAGEPPTL